MTEFHNQFEQQEEDLRKVFGPRKKESEDKSVQLIFGPGHRIVQPAGYEAVTGHSIDAAVPADTTKRQAGFSFSGYQIRLPDGSIHDFGMDEAAYDAYVALFLEDKRAAHQSIGWDPDADKSKQPNPGILTSQKPNEFDSFQRAKLPQSRACLLPRRK